MTPDPCPRCFAPPREDGRPDCSCAARLLAAEAASVASSAPELSVDQDHLHVRPYVAPHDEDGSVPEAAPLVAPDAEEDTVRRPASSPEHTYPEAAPSTNTERDRGGEREQRHFPDEGPPGYADGERVEDGDGEAWGDGDAGNGVQAPPARRRKIGLLVLATAAAVAVVAVSWSLVLGGRGDQEAPGTSAAVPVPGNRSSVSDPTPFAGTDPDDPTASGSLPAGATEAPVNQADDTVAAEDPSSATVSPLGEQTGQAGGDPVAPQAGDVTSSAAGMPSGGPSPDDGPTLLREGDSGEEVVELQKRLGQLLLGYLGAPDGQYDASLRRAVARFQDSRDITSDPAGVYGPATRSELESRTREP